VRIRISAIWAAFALGVGAFVLLGYFVAFPLVRNLQLVFMQWAVLLAAAALFMGLINIVSVHWRKLSLQEEGWIYSAVLILAFIVTLVIALLPPLGPSNPTALFIFNHLQLPIESSLMALLSVSLLIAGFRLVQRRRNVFSLLFVGTALLVMLGTGPWIIGGQSAFFLAISDVRAWISQVWAAGGARGILMGVALGATATGLRVLMGADRPYGG
jgi:hypothetical protein